MELDKLKENYLPNAMPDRGPQLQRIRDLLESATEGEPAGSVWEIGPCGVGKTSTVKFLLRKLRDDWGVASTYVSCVSTTRWEALKQVADAHPSVIAQPNASTDRLRERIAKADEPFVVILDEISGLEQPDLLADLGSIE